MSLAKMFGVVAIGMPLTLFSTAQVAFLVRKYVQTEMLDAPTADSLPPFGRMHFITWGEGLHPPHIPSTTPLYPCTPVSHPSHCSPPLPSPHPTPPCPIRENLVCQLG